jgi:hypothetical protein
MASVLHRLGDLEGCRARLHLAQGAAGRAGVSAAIEIDLLAARLATDDDRPRAEALFASIDAALADPALERGDRLCYRARLLCQRAYHLTKPVEGTSADLEGAVALFEDIEEDPSLPFVSFRRCAGLAYCRWKLGDAAEGARLARLAAEHAGDAGLVRFRIMALNLLTRMVPAGEAVAVNARAERLARQLEDEDLLRRVRHRAPGSRGE